MTTSGTAAPSGLVCFEVGTVLYALDIHDVCEVIRPLSVHRLAELPQDVMGVADHRGDVVPVVDLRMRFGVSVSPSQGTGRWVIVRRGVRLVAFAVDRVVEVLNTSRLAPRATPELGHGEAARGIVGAHAYRGQLVFVVDAALLAAVALGLDAPSLRLPAAVSSGEHGNR